MGWPGTGDGGWGRHQGGAEVGCGRQSVRRVRVVEGGPSTEAPALREQLDGKQVGTGIGRGQSTTSGGGVHGGDGCPRQLRQKERWRP
jgi:hypothetical protein